jgi:hypothetical protein
MTHLGAPMIYYGDEAGMWEPMIHAAVSRCCGKIHVCGRNPAGRRLNARRPDTVTFDADLFAHYSG